VLRRLGLAALVVVAFAFAGASAGPARPIALRQLAVSIAWPDGSEQAEPETQPLPRPRIPYFVAVVSVASQSVGVRRLPHERWLFQRPPPLVA